MGRWVIGLFVVAAALAAPASLAQVVLGPSVYHSADLPSNTITTFTVTCPPGHMAVSAGISNPAPGVTLLSIRPVGLRAYTFRFGNPVTNPDQQVTAVVACRTIGLSAKARFQLKLKPLQLKVKLPPGKLTAADLLCPPNMTPAGWGEDIAPVQSEQSYIPVGTAQLSVRKASMDLRGFSFSVRNSGRKTQSVVLYGSCITVVRAASATALRLHVKITTFRTLLHPGGQKLSRGCPSGWVSLAAGYALRSPVTTIDGAAAIGAAGRWWVTSDSVGSTEADLQLGCARLGK